MILAYGNYRHALYEAGLSVQRETTFSPAQIPKTLIERWTISGWLQADSQAALLAAMQAMTAAYAVQSQDAILYLPDGVTKTPHQLISRDSIGGVRVTRQPSFDEWRGGELGLFRTYTISLEAEFAYRDAASQLLEWEETLTFSGGGPRFVYLGTLNGLPIRQQVQQCTSYRVAQSGRAVGFFAWPSPAYPIWPIAEHIDQRQISRSLPHRRGADAGAADIEYAVTWGYQFESALPLFGLPTPRPS